MTTGEAFGLTPGADPAAFDVDAWIAQAARPQRTVTIYARADLIARLDEIDAEVTRLRRTHAQQASAAGDASLEDAAPDTGGRIAALEAEWDATAAQFSASAMPVTIRGLTEAEQAAAVRAAGTSDPTLAKAQNAEWAELVGLHIVAAAIVSPHMTLDQVRAVHARIGGAAFAPLANAVRALTNQAPVVPATPFSKPSSQAART